MSPFRAGGSGVSLGVIPGEGGHRKGHDNSFVIGCLHGHGDGRLGVGGHAVVDIFQQHAKAPERIDTACDDAYIHELAEAVTGRLGGKVGVLVEVNCETDFVARSEQFIKFAHEVALQVAAAAPKYIKEEDIPADVLEHETEIAKGRAKEEGKPEAMLEKIAQGRLEKFKDEVVLLRQPYIRDDKVTIGKLLLEQVAAIGENIVVRRIVRWELGEISG